MTTRAKVGLLSDDGTIESIYVHNSGYPEGLGQTLKMYYKDINRIQELLDEGDAFIVKAEIGERHAFDEQDKATKKGWSTFYTRDRRQDAPSALSDNEDAFISRGSSVDYLYLFKDGKWYLSKRMEAFEPLSSYVESINPVMQGVAIILEEKEEEEDYTLVWNSKKKFTVPEIWQMGNKISGGHGFWGSYDLLSHNNPREMVNAFVDALREEGHSDVDIIFYGDWSDGRHVADYIEEDTTYKEFKEIVKRDSRPAKEVHNYHLDGTYDEKIKELYYLLT